MYAFVIFKTNADRTEIVDSYRNHYNKKYSQNNHVIVAVNVICAETSEKANEIAKSSFLWKIQQDKQLEQHTVPTVEAAKNYPFTNRSEERRVGKECNARWPREEYKEKQQRGVR